jgi:hypothetical protein
MEAQSKMGRVDSFASMVELTDYHHCDMCVPGSHAQGTVGSGGYHASPHATLNSMPNSL